MFFVSTGYDATGKRYKVESMLARLRGVARRHKAMGLTFVLLASAMQAADGIVQQHSGARSRRADAEVQRAAHPSGNRRPPLVPAWHSRGRRPCR
eukprot:4786378-Pleurochrysis_carterae.AAC.1